MAKSKRRGEDDGDERLNDDATVDGVADDDVADGDDATDADEPVSRGGTATRKRAQAEPAEGRKTRKDTERIGLFARIARFFREVVAELRKVIWPTRKELLTYTAVVVTFVAVMLAIVAGLDYGFAKAVLWVFGESS
ncbi:preprotein translocase subunit SecE [Micromonospora chalcea]|uniref:preprotein translocase subunit SecE n=1 Tax=unclassified Micromonospora TaxID=2617518 RepID=UPI00093E377E|nr:MULTISPECIES: preprotein translocase subunit SecE [unclassified Micromonospora]AXO36821.1 preprotein translocase subunit SecE [Micromonospora sp. B006]OKJ44327.1 preprotein translocase subunit SecE [Micromonospora sp. TSRI0369]